MWRNLCNRVFNRDNLTLRELVFRFFILTFLQTTIILLSTIINPATINYVPDTTSPVITHINCVYPIIFIGITITYELFFVMLTSFYCFILSKFDLRIVGSVAVYVVLLLSISCLPVFFLLDPISKAALWLFPLSNIAALSIPLLLMFIPKVIWVKAAREDLNITHIGSSFKVEDYDISSRLFRSNSTPLENIKTPSSSVANIDKSPQELREDINRQLETISSLENKLLKKKNRIKELEGKLYREQDH